MSRREAALLRAALARHESPLRNQLPALVDGVSPERLVAMARLHRVAGALYLALAALPAPVELTEALRPAFDEAVRLHMRSLGDLTVLDTTFGAVGIPWLVVKGPVLQESLYGAAGARNYGDLDVLVPGARFAEALASLEAAGLTVIDRNWLLLRERRASEINLVGRFGVTIDLHWHLVYGHDGRAAYALDIPGMFERSVDLLLGAVRVRTLCPEDTLLHLCLHAALGGGHRLVWLADVDRAASVPELQWDRVVELADRQRLGLVTALMLRRSQAVFGTSFPDRVVRRLAPRGRGWLALEGISSRLTDIPQALDRGSPARAVARATRADQRASVRDLRRRVGRLRPANVRLLAQPERRGLLTADLLKSAGDEADRAAYLDAVAEEARGSRRPGPG